MKLIAAIKKTGKTFLLLSGVLCLMAQPLRAASVEFTAEADRSQISLDESVSLRLKVKTEGNTQLSPPQFSAPDFDEVNQYSSVFVESYYENGRFGVRNNQILTKVLRPQKIGQLKILNIKISAGGQAYDAPDITITVLPAGAGTPPPKGYGGSGVGLRGSGKQSHGRNLFVRAEIDKDRAYKGEQIIVSYYLYTRVQLFNISVEKWPIFTGFLKSDLETPVLNPSGRMDSERVILDGASYRRSLLVRYALYPLQEGKLKIDPIGLKLNYYPTQGLGSDNEDDDPFSQFFRQLNPRTTTERSDSLTIDALPIPDEGKPASFTGGVGDFTLTATVDKMDVKTNEALTLVAKVEGRGNLASIGEPKATWPSEVELYDTKGHAKSGRAGVGEKIFEFLLIPRVSGTLKLPPLELSYFDPVKKTFITKTTQAITINVLQGQGQSAYPTRNTPSTQSLAAPDTLKDKVPSYLKVFAPTSADARAPGGWPIWRWLYVSAAASFCFFVLLVGFDLFKKGQAAASHSLLARAQAAAKNFESLKIRAKNPTISWPEILDVYELLTELLLETLERTYPIGVKSVARSELKLLLIETYLFPAALWTRLENLLDFVDTVRFAASAGAVSEEMARQDLLKWVGEAQSIARLIERQSDQKN